MSSEVGVAKGGKTLHRDATQAQPSNLSRQCSILPVPDSPPISTVNWPQRLTSSML